MCNHPQYNGIAGQPAVSESHLSGEIETAHTYKLFARFRLGRLGLYADNVRTLARA